jgi:hypothetical protein
MTKNVIIVVLTAVLFVVAFALFYRWDSAQNRGSEHGYYGEFNRVSNALATIPGVTITQSWHNLDVTLEEFGFGFTFGGHPVRLYFGESDPIRTMSRKDLLVALLKRIETELPVTNK